MAEVGMAVAALAEEAMAAAVLVAAAWGAAAWAEEVKEAEVKGAAVQVAAVLVEAAWAAAATAAAPSAAARAPEADSRTRSDSRNCPSNPGAWCPSKRSGRTVRTGCTSESSCCRQMTAPCAPHTTSNANHARQHRRAVRRR